MLGPPSDPILRHISWFVKTTKTLLFPLAFCHFWHMKDLFKAQDHFKIIGQHSLDGRSPSADHGNVDLLFIMPWNTDTQLVPHHPSIHLLSQDAHIMDMSRMAQ